jgi:hypothetical protein
VDDIGGSSAGDEFLSLVTHGLPAHFLAENDHGRFPFALVYSAFLGAAGIPASIIRGN